MVSVVLLPAVPDSRLGTILVLTRWRSKLLRVDAGSLRYEGVISKSCGAPGSGSCSVVEMMDTCPSGFSLVWVKTLRSRRVLVLSDIG